MGGGGNQLWMGEIVPTYFRHRTPPDVDVVVEVLIGMLIPEEWEGKGAACHENCSAELLDVGCPAALFFF